MEYPQQNLISNTAKQCAAAKALIQLTKEIDTLYNGPAGYGALITQEQIDSVPSFAAAGLTKADLDAAIFIIKQVNVALETVNFPALVIVASLA